MPARRSWGCVRSARRLSRTTTRSSRACATGSGRSRAPAGASCRRRTSRAALRELGMRSEFEIAGAPLRSIARIVDGRRVTFLANPVGEDVRARVTVPAEVGRAERMGSRRLADHAPLTESPVADGRRLVRHRRCRRSGRCSSCRVRARVAGSRHPVAPSRWRDAGRSRCPAAPRSSCPRGPCCGPRSTTRRAAFSGTAAYRTEFDSPIAGSGERVARLARERPRHRAGRRQRRRLRRRVDRAVPRGRHGCHAGGVEHARGRGRDAVAQPADRRGVGARPERSSRR